MTIFFFFISYKYRKFINVIKGVNIIEKAAICHQVQYEYVIKLDGKSFTLIIYFSTSQTSMAPSIDNDILNRQSSGIQMKCLRHVISFID